MPHSMHQAVRLLAALALVAPPSVQAAITSIADEPLITQSEFKPKPNMMVILDDSGSMNWSYMPDDLGKSTNATDEPNDWYGYKAAQCNGVAFDPTITYSAPLKADGTLYPNASFTAAWDDGYTQSGSTNLMGTGTTYSADRLSSTTASSATFTFTSGINASTFKVGDVVTVSRGSSSYSGTVTSWTSSRGTYTLVIDASGISSSPTNNWKVTTQGSGQIYYTYSGSQEAMGWTYNANGTLKNSTFNTECKTLASSSSTVFNKVSVTSSSANATNYANWYSYYRKRYLLMRTAMGKAMQPLDDKYRLGFMTINKQAKASGTGDSDFRPVTDFDATQKGLFYSSLYSVSANGGTPLREALSTAGKYFAKKYSTSQATDPMQYACQRNYALLTTDGYWNGNAGSGLTSSGTITTLADVATQYYTTDLRTDTLRNCTGAPVNGTSQDVCANIVPPAGRDNETKQHMTTFTLGVGA